MSKYRMFYQVILCIIGALFCILGYVEEVNSIWGSIGFAFIVCSSLRIFRELKMEKNPEYKREVMIAQYDERNIKISEKSASFTFRFSIFCFCIIELILFVFGLTEIGTILGTVVAVMLLVYWLSWWYYNKKI